MEAGLSLRRFAGFLVFDSFYESVQDNLEQGQKDALAHVRGDGAGLAQWEEVFHVSAPFYVVCLEGGV